MRVVYAKQSVSLVMPEGHSVFIPLGTHWSADDPVVKANPNMFSDDPRFGLYGQPPAEPDTEQATAAPGEKRNARRG